MKSKGGAQSNITGALKRFGYKHTQKEDHVMKTKQEGSHLYGEGNGTPLQYSCLENPTDGGAWWAAVHGVAKGQT